MAKTEPLVDVGGLIDYAEDVRIVEEGGIDGVWTWEWARGAVRGYHVDYDQVIEYAIIPQPVSKEYPEGTIWRTCDRVRRPEKP